MEWKWDKWQQEVIDHKGPVTIRKGRQVGGSAATSKRRADQMIEYPETTSLVIAPAQRQSSELFIKTRAWLEVKHMQLIKEAGSYKSDPNLSEKRNMEARRLFEYDNGLYNAIPTKTTIILKKYFNKPQHPILNVGSKYYALPAGQTGVFLRNYTLDFLDIDEAAYVPEPVYNALKPMLAISAREKKLGWETFLSTPFGKGGFFYDSHQDKDFRQFHISSETCPRIGADFLAKERARLSKMEYAQEWLGEFTDDWRQFFPTALLKKQATFIEWSKKTDYNSSAGYYLGVDFARYGADHNAFVICELLNKKLKIVKALKTERVSTTDAIGFIRVLDDIYHFKRIFVDSGGLGAAILDQLHEKVEKRKVIGLDNATKRIEVQGEEKKRGIFKEDLYSNALMLMETGHLELISNLDLLKSLKSITFEYTSDKNLKIFGDYSHLTEALVRACWCIKERGLNLYIY